ncbi:olfactory receptor 52R1-like [Mauremys mutica]|uniref:olfactory receptor 52R1-like n=1 Tax=Mauremys mutica TaxID=74926 RepID=UPI001D1385FF|nr:olfactory receptor 52R1-like [Mauremys mutica]
MYTIAVFGNFTILFIVKRERSLRAPMYYFLCMLAITDLVLSTSMVPKMLSIFWFNSREIDFSACLTQIHSTLLANHVVAKIGLAVVLRGGILILPYLILTRQWPYCETNIIPDTYCAHIAVVKLACADTRISSYYGLFVLFCVKALFSSLTYRFGQNVALHFRVLIGNVNLLVPPTLNPIIYGVRTKQIRDRLLRLFIHKDI